MDDLFGTEPQQNSEFLFEDSAPVVSENEVTRRQLTASALGGMDFGNAVKEEYLAKGSSDLEEAMLAEYQARFSDKFKDDMDQITMDPAMGTEQKIQALRAHAKAMAETPPASTLGLLREQYIAMSSPPNRNAEEVHNALVEHYAEMPDLGDEYKKVLANLDLPQTLAGQVGDFLVAGFMPSYNIMHRNVLNTVVPGLIPISDLLPWPLGGAGDMRVAFKKHFDVQPPEEKVRLIRALGEAINNYKFVGIENGFWKMDLTENLVGNLNEANADQTFDNVIGTLDYIGWGLIAGAGKLGGKAVTRATQGAKETRTITTAAGTNVQVTARAKVLNQIEEALKARGTDKDTIDQIIMNHHELPRGNTVLKAMDQADPEGSKKLKEEALKDTTGKVANASGATREQIANEGLLSKMPGSPVSPAPTLHSLDDTIMEIDVTNSLYTEGERAAAIAASGNKLDEALNDIVMAAPSVHLNKMDIDIIPGGYVSRYIIEDSTTRGFSSIKMAEATAKTFREFDNANTTILVRNYKTDEFVPLEQAKAEKWYDQKAKNEYAIQMNVVEYLSPELHARGDVPIFHDRALVGKMASWWDKSATFVSWITRAGNIAVDQKSNKLAAMNRMLKPMTRLKDRDQQKIIHVLDQGDQDKKWYTNKELIDQFWANEPNAADLIDGYRAVIRHNQVVYSELNKRARKELNSAGYKHMIFDKKIVRDGFSNMGRPVNRTELVTVAEEGLDVSTTPKPIKRIYDGERKRVVDIDPDNLDADFLEQHTFYRLQSPAWVDKEQFQFVMIKKGSDTGIQIKNLPKHVLQNTPGYVARVYDSPYILKAKRHGQLDGHYHPRIAAVRMYANKGDMLRDMERLQLEQAGLPKSQQVEYVPTEAKELRSDLEFGHRTSLEYFEHSGQLFTSTRGAEVKGMDGKRMLRSISNALEVMRNRAASANTVEPLVDKLIKNWEEKYGKAYSETGKMPWNADDIGRNSQDIRKTAEYGQAVAFQRHIKLLSGVDDTATTTAMRQMMINVSEYLSQRFDNTLASNIASRLVRGRRANIINAAKGAAFTNFIIFNPIRQLILQSQQMSVYLGLDHAFKYFTTGGGTRDFAGLIVGNLYRHTDQWKWAKEYGAKVTGMSPDEYEKLVDAYKKTGLPSSIDHHMYSLVSNLERQHAGNLKELGMNPAWGKTVEYFNNLRWFMRRIGFDAGEHTQLMAGFLAVRNRWMKNNPTKAHLWSQEDNLLEIAGQTRTMSFNMNEAGILQFQRGALGMIFQFMSHATKSMQVLLPSSVPGIGKFANKEFTRTEKLRILGSQFLMYGTGAYGLNSMYEALKGEIGAEIPPDVDAYVQEGIIGTLMNLTFSMLGDDEPGGLETNLDLSQSLAPFSGIGGRNQIVGLGNPFGYIIDAAFLNPKELIEAAGPVPALGKKALDGWKFIRAALGTAPVAELGTPELTLALDEAGRQVFPILSNFMRARAMDAMDRHISASGNVGVEVTDGETWGMRLLGAQSKRQRQVNDMMIEIRGLVGHPQEEGIRHSLNEDAKELYKFITRKALLVGDNKGSIDDVVRELNSVSTLLQQSLADDEYLYVMDRIRDKFVEERTKSTEGQLRSAILGIAGSTPSLLDKDFFTELENMTPFNGQQELIDGLKEWLHGI